MVSTVRQWRVAAGAHCGSQREIAVDVHQARTGHWFRLSQYLHRIGKRLVGNECSGCIDPVCDGAKCGLCTVEADSSEHIFSTFTCPALFRAHAGSYGKHLVPTRNIDFHKNDKMADI
jgi:hypothetical protein